MLFLDFELGKPETWLSGAAEGIMGSILSGFRTLLFNITSFVYELISNIYNIFDKLCKARMLDNDVIEILAQRIGVVLGLVMFFYVVFSFIQMLVTPEKLADKEKGAIQIVKKAILVIVMLGVSSSLFEIAFGIQKKIIETNVISKLLVPYSIEVNGDSNYQFGNMLSMQLMRAFYKKEEIKNLATDDQGYYDQCDWYTQEFFNQVFYDNKYDLGYVCLNANVTVVNEDGTNDEVYATSFNGILAILVGGYVVYILTMYCFKIGVRMVQLAFLEIISPMAFISYLQPKKDTILSKWWKIYFSTYIDVFIRIAIINLVVFLISVLFSNDSIGGNLSILEIYEGNGFLGNAFLSVIIILSLLTFAKKAPDLIKELLPASASKLGFGTAMKDIFGLNAVVGGIAGLGIGTMGRVPSALGDTAKAIGMIGSATGWKNKLKAFGGALGTATGSTLGVATGAITGTFKGGASGAKSKGGVFSALHEGQKGAAKANLERRQRQLAGGHWYDGISKGVNSFFGDIGEYDYLESEVGSLNELKADIEGEDVVKNMIQQANTAYHSYYEAQRAAGIPDSRIMSQDDWIKANYKSKIDAAKQRAYNDLYTNKDSAFRAKVDMHNRRFRKTYGAGSHWKDINDTRKSKAAELEKIKAKKPKK